MDPVPRVTIGAYVFNSEGELLLLKSHKWRGQYIVPCGHVEYREKLEDAVRREVREESGLEVYDLNFMRVFEFIDPPTFTESESKGAHFVGIQYACRSDKRDVTLNEEAEKFLWVKPKQSLGLDLEYGTKDTIEFLLSNNQNL